MSVRLGPPKQNTKEPGYDRTAGQLRTCRAMTETQVSIINIHHTYTHTHIFTQGVAAWEVPPMQEAGLWAGPGGGGQGETVKLSKVVVGRCQLVYSCGLVYLIEFFPIHIHKNHKHRSRKCSAEI